MNLRQSTFSRRNAFALAILLSAVSATLGADPVNIRGNIDAVTVYRGQALVTRVIDLPKDVGLQDIVVTDLPAAILQGSVYAEVEGDAQVRNVRARMRAVMDDVREEVRKLDLDIAKLAQSVAAEQSQLDVLSRHSAYLDTLEGFAAPTANVELTRGVLNAETLQKLTEFILAERQKVATGTLTGQQKLADLNGQIELLNRKKGEITGGAQKTAREAVLTVDVKKAGAKVRLKYLVANASWAPSYTLRAATGSADVDLHYQAMVTQVSGEDWSNVKMTLSTATPSVIARAPTLDVMTVALVNAGENRDRDQAAQSVDYARALSQRRSDAFNNFAGNASHDGVGGQMGAGSVQPQGELFKDNLKALNSAAAEAQQLEYTARKEVAVEINRQKPTESVTVTYVLPDTTSLPSRSDQQLVSIASVKMAGEFYKLAVPVLTSYVYNEAKVTNASNQLLLAGPTMSYLDGDFVGAGDLPTVAAGEQFTVGFGIDSSLRVQRELVDKTESISGGNKITGFEYRISLENFGASPATIRVQDRLPVSSGKELKVQLVSSDPKPMDDAELLKKKGMLQWTLGVKPQAIGAAATTIRYSLSIEHDRNLSLVGTGGK